MGDVLQTTRKTIVPTSTVQTTAADERRVKREADITRSVMAAVGVRLLCATVPAIVFGSASAMHRKGERPWTSIYTTQACWKT